ncbi:MAG TPA: Asd/ArgC dimerization domain-containing protein [Thermoanaerobaculia bacterium]|nr:Asd/ArgC dimerization domain-containing protein [Thermoanaerobaculia bacterium]
MPHPKNPAGYRLGIINPLTLVGNELKTILRERAFPYAKVALLDASGTAHGALTEVDDEPAMVASVAQEGLDDLDLVFFCGPAEPNREWIARHEQDDFIAVDLSQPTTADDGKLAIAGVNLEELDAGDELLVSPHPVAIPIALILRQVATLSPVEICAATVVQPASELGQAGVEELAQQTMSVLSVQSVPKTVFDRQLAFNLYPALERNEEFIVSQIRGIGDPRTQIALLITQGTIFHSHTFSLFLKTKDELTADQIRDALRANPTLVFPEGDQQFGTIDAAGKDEVLIAEVRPDPGVRGGFWVWAVCDNLRRSSALNAVLVAEKVLFGTGVH